MGLGGGFDFQDRFEGLFAPVVDAECLGFPAKACKAEHEMLIKFLGEVIYLEPLLEAFYRPAQFPSFLIGTAEFLNSSDEFMPEAFPVRDRPCLC